MDQPTTSRFRELKTLALIFIVLLLLFRIVFYHEDILTITKTIITIYWLFIIPGYCMTIIWKQECALLERFLISIPISTAVLGIVSYYLALFGILPLSILAWTLTPTIILITILAQYTCTLVKDKSNT